MQSHEKEHTMTTAPTSPRVGDLGYCRHCSDAIIGVETSRGSVWCHRNSGLIQCPGGIGPSFAEPKPSDDLGREYTEKQEQQILAYREKLLSGEAFYLASASHGSVLGYKPPPSHRDVAALYTAAGKLAAMGDVFVPFAMALAQAGGQYQSTPELLKHAYGALGRVTTTGYTDVIRLASPEPGRRRDAQRAYTLREILTVRGVMDTAECSMSHTGGLPGPGWCAHELRIREGLGEWKRPA